jgi:hypothetical protein
MGLDQLCENGIGFFNCTRETLMIGYMALLPKERVVLEILETISTGPGSGGGMHPAQDGRVSPGSRRFSR